LLLVLQNAQPPQIAMLPGAWLRVKTLLFHMLKVKRAKDERQLVDGIRG
jgi:hypothetical protein